MKVSLNWMKMYGGLGLDASIDELLRHIGSQLGAVEGFENLGEKYRGVVIAKVVSCEKHGDSDHLNVCRIDDGGVISDVERGEDGMVQVVCGAPNVRAGLTVAWLPPGSTVPESVGSDPFVLGARELRGVMSNGMLASAKELALGESHDGIAELDSGRPGDDFAAVYQLDDYVIELENKMFTHRPDCFGQLGVARELAGIQGLAFKSPDWYRPKPALPVITPDLPLEVRNEIPELVPRFTAVAIADVHVGPSPFWLQTYLLRCGIGPISNIVDLTNYYMLLTGQPLHAYDYDKLRAIDNSDTATLVARQPYPGEKITLLNGKEVEPRAEAIIIATEQRSVGIGGVMGGADTEVDADTENIVLECATFDMYSIRRTSMAHGLFTDAVTRNNKGQSPLQNLAVLARIAADVTEHAGGKVASQFIDLNQQSDRQWVHPPVPVSIDFVNSRLGSDLTAEAMATLLRNVEFEVTLSSDEQTMTIAAPFWRTDIETREDVIEEIGRLYSFDKLPLVLPNRSIQPAHKDALLELKQQIRELLARAGANEVLNYSFVHEDLLTKAGQDKAQAFQVSNALSPDLQYYRLSLTPSLLDKIHPNMKAGYSEFALFEIGKGHNLSHIDSDDGLPTEFEMLDLVYSRSEKLRQPGAAFYEVRRFLNRLANQLGLQLEYRPIEQQEEYEVAKPYDPARSAQVFLKDTELPLGMIGEYKPSVRKAFKLSPYSAGFGIGLSQLMQAAARPTLDWYDQLPRFPKVTQDITFKIAADQLFQPFHAAYLRNIDDAKSDRTSVGGGLMDIYQSAEDPLHKQFSFRLTIASFDRTMTDSEVTKLLDTVAASLQAEFGSERI